jgi:predicted alpha-1,2-mannosidase
MIRALLLALLVVRIAGAVDDPAQYVNTFTGTGQRNVDFGTGGGAGNTFPGAVAPFGMIQWSPDTVPAADAAAGGYSYGDDVIRGFSLTHLSGPGCPVFMDVPILPTVTPIATVPSVAGTYEVAPEYLPVFDHADEDAAPGWYRVRLDPGTPEAIDVELAARTRSAVGRFTFPATTAASVLVNAGGSAMANGDVAIAVDSMANEISGSVRAGQFCYHRNRYTLYFTIRFDRPFAASGTWSAGALSPGSSAASGHVDAPFHLRPLSGFDLPPTTSNTVPVGAWASFDTTVDAVVRARVGISWVSVDAARANLAAETPDADIDAVRAETRAAWNEALGRIDVAGGAPSSTRTFYTMLYHALLAPSVFSDVDGAYVGMDGAPQQADGWTKYANVSGWDVYRAQVPLVAMLQPRRASDLVRSLLADARESGWLPRWPVANGQTDVMVGDPAAAIIAGAYALGARDFDTGEALAAMVRGGTETGTSDNAEYVERQGLADYLRLGWVPHDGSELSSGASTSMFGSTSNVWGSAATTIEYAVADFAISRFAAATGDRRTARTFLRRSGGWKRLLNRATGYLEPRRADGSFVDGFDPHGLEGFAEGNAAQYRWQVPFDPAGLVDALGGAKKVLPLLDHHFQELDAGPLSEFAFLGNEPEMSVPWLYDWLGQPWKTQRVVRAAMTTLFDDTPAGYTGNDDLGAMSAWYVFAALGLYPAIPADGVFALGSPLFPEATLRLPGGDVVIHGAGAAADAPYVQSLRLDGRRWDKPWLRWEQLACGTTLEFTLGAAPNPRWGRARRLAPPSFPAGGRVAPPRKPPRCG